MDCAKEKLKMARLDLERANARKQLNKRRAELREQDLELRKKHFDKLPAKERRIHEMLGWSPYQRDRVIARVGGTITTKNC